MAQVGFGVMGEPGWRPPWITHPGREEDSGQGAAPPVTGVLASEPGTHAVCPDRRDLVQSDTGKLCVYRASRTT